MKAGIISSKFLEIDKIQHYFPQELHKIGFSTTLLHNHQHAPINHVLVYQQDYKMSTYKSKSQAEKIFHPCSWYLQNNQPCAYQFTDQLQPFDLQIILKELQLLDDKNYQCYGVTVRPIRDKIEIQTKTGHLYIDSEQFKEWQKMRVSQTAIAGISYDGCMIGYKCVPTYTGHQMVPYHV